MILSPLMGWGFFVYKKDFNGLLFLCMLSLFILCLMVYSLFILPLVAFYMTESCSACMGRRVNNE